jgi:WD40 repeat protein
LQIVDDRLFSGSVDGSLKVWDISDLKSAAPANPQPKMSKSARDKTETRSDADSGIEDHEDRKRRAQNMV